MTAASCPTNSISSSRPTRIVFVEGESYECVGIELLLCFSIVDSCLSFSSAPIIYSFECHASKGLIEIGSGHIKVILRQMGRLALTRNISVVGRGGGIRAAIAIGLLVLLIGLPAFTWPYRRIYTTITEGPPVDLSEELMLHSALDTEHSQPLAGIPFKELTDARS